MARKRRKAKKSFIIITLITISLIAMSLLTINNYFLIKKEIEKNKELTIAAEEVKKNTNEAANINNNLSKEIEDLKHLEANIANKKSNVFELAKKLENKITKNETNYKIAYLTFDDGPYHLTDEYLAILKKYKVKATFFTIGLDKDTCYDNKSYSCKETYKKIVDNGHTIANHTYSHAIFNGLYTNADSFINQVKTQENLIKERTGITTNIVRFPGGSATARALSGSNVNKIMEELKKRNYGWVDWTAQDGDGGYVANSDIAWNNFTGSINENIEVVLFHDYSYQTLAILPRAIEYLQARNYIILPLFYESIKVNK